MEQERGGRYQSRIRAFHWPIQRRPQPSHSDGSEYVFAIFSSLDFDFSCKVQDYYRLIDQISDVLRPGGLIDIAEVELVAYDRNHQPIPVTDPTPGTRTWGEPYWAHWVRAVSNVARDRLGGDVTAARHLHEWVSGHQAYEDVTYHEFWLPIIPGNFDRPPVEAEFLKGHRLALEYDVLVCQIHSTRVAVFDPTCYRVS